jgi:Dimethlysulfonioproprionate lyase
VVRVDLGALVAAAVGLYLASGNQMAARAAELMKQACPVRPAAPPQALAVLAHLSSVDFPPLEADSAALFRDNASHLPWAEDGFVLPAAIRGRNAYAELVGPEGPLLSPQCRFGFYLQAPDCLYPAHSHAAEELYMILSGSVEWWVDGMDAFVPPMLGLVHHRPWQKHAMRTGPLPLLAMWAWLGDIRYSTYSI